MTISFWIFLVSCQHHAGEITYWAARRSSNERLFAANRQINRLANGFAVASRDCYMSAACSRHRGIIAFQGCRRLPL